MVFFVAQLTIIIPRLDFWWFRDRIMRKTSDLCSDHVWLIFTLVQDGPLRVIDGVITLRNDLINGELWLFHPYKWSYNPIHNWWRGPPCRHPNWIHHLAVEGVLEEKIPSIVGLKTISSHPNHPSPKSAAQSWEWIENVVLYIENVDFQ